MLDGVSLDQLRTFIAAVDEGSFSAAGRKLLRAQSVVSQAIGNLEEQLGVALFDRTARYPKLTLEGQVLLVDARAIIDGVDAFKARAKGMSGGLEAELSVVVDVMFPITAVTQVAHEYAAAFPATPLRLHVEALGAVAQSVMNGDCSLGVVGSLPDAPGALTVERLLGMLMVMVAAPTHPLSQKRGPLGKKELSRHTQIILTDHTTLSEGRSFGVMSPNVWRLTDLGAKHAFLRAGLGWGGMPMAAVQDDVSAGALKVLAIEDTPPGGVILPMSIVYPAASPPGPAGRWFIDALRRCAQIHDAGVRASPPP